MRSFDLPVYDGDVVATMAYQRGAKRLHNEFPCDEAPNLAAIRGKLVAMISCSAGMLCGSRAFQTMSLEI